MGRTITALILCNIAHARHLSTGFLRPILVGDLQLSPLRVYGPGMDETQELALRALRELVDDPERNDWDDLLGANRALIKAIETGEPMTRRNARIVAEYLREAGWQEHAIRAATAQAGTTGYADLRETG